MKTEIDHGTIEAALIKLGDASAREIANETGLEAKDITHTLNDMRTAAAVEREKRGSEYVYWLTTTASAKPKAAASFPANKPAPDPAAKVGETITAWAERCAAQKPEAAGTHQEEFSLLNVIADIRQAIGDNEGRIMLSDLAEHITDRMLERSVNTQAVVDALVLVADYLPDSSYRLRDGIRTMDMLIDAQQAYIHGQTAQIGTQAAMLESADREAADYRAQITELRSRIEFLTGACFQNAAVASRGLTEVHEALANGWPIGFEAPTGRTTLQLAQDMARDFDATHSAFLQTKFPTPDAYLVTRLFRSSKGKIVTDSGGPTRHKSIDTATRKARAAIRAGYVRAEVHAITLVAIGGLGPEIKSV